MNELLFRYGEDLAILGFPCNQFGHQENSSNGEIINSLRYVRPGNNFESKITIFAKVDVNGDKSHSVFRYLRHHLPTPHDDPVSFLKNPQCIIWSPVTRSDVSWNFEKFLIDKDGRPFRRYGPRYQTISLDPDIAELISK